MPTEAGKKKQAMTWQVGILSQDKRNNRVGVGGRELTGIGFWRDLS